jgi:hypothetical protein
MKKRMLSNFIQLSCSNPQPESSTQYPTVNIQQPAMFDRRKNMFIFLDANFRPNACFAPINFG